MSTEHISREGISSFLSNNDLFLAEADAYVLDFTRWISLNFLFNSSVTLPANSPVVEFKGPFVPSKYVDEAWHNFILFTKQYHVSIRLAFLACYPIVGVVFQAFWKIYSPCP